MKKLSANPIAGAAALALLFLSVFVLPDLMLSRTEETARVVLPLWVPGALAGLAFVLLGLAGDAGRQLVGGAGAIFLLLLKVIHPLHRTMSGEWDANGVLPGIPAFGDASAFLLGLLAVCGMFGVIACVRGKAIPKGTPLWALLWVVAAALAGAADSASAVFRQLHMTNYEGSMLALHIAALFLLLAAGFLAGFLLLKKQNLPHWVRVAVIVLAALGLLRVALAMPGVLPLSRLHWLLAMPGALPRVLARWLQFPNAYQAAAAHGLLLAAGVRCMMRGSVAKADTAQETQV